MKTAIIILSIIPAFIIPQTIKFQSPQNIKRFADYLFCDRDYLRAIEEYQKYLKLIDSDTAKFKIAISYANMNDYRQALYKFNNIEKPNIFYQESQIEKLKCLFILGDDSLFTLSAEEMIKSNSAYASYSNKLLNASLLLKSTQLPEKESYLYPFNIEERSVFSEYFDRKNDPPHKSPVLAGIFSTILPGSGKIYTENYGDGVTAFLLTGLFTYLAYTNFDHDHDTRAWIFTTIGAGFYVGNIYGSIASAQLFNAQINFEFIDGVKFYLKEKNYFAPEYDFCK